MLSLGLWYTGYISLVNCKWFKLTDQLWNDLERIKNEDVSKPHQDRQECWLDLIWASHIYWCLSRRLAHSGTRCGRAGGLASGSLGKSRLQGCPSRGSKNIPIMWHRTKGRGKLLLNNVVQQNEHRLVLTARINRLSVAAGNISFSRVIFLQWAHWQKFYDIRTVCLWETEIKDHIHRVPMKPMNLFPFNYF